MDTDDTYTVYEAYKRVVATEMSLEDALILVKALMEKYYCEPSLSFTITRNMPKAKVYGENQMLESLEKNIIYTKKEE